MALPNVIVMAPGIAQQKKLLVVRNTSKYDFVVKLVTGKGSGLTLEKAHLVVGSQTFAQTSITYKAEKTQKKCSLLVYARALNGSNTESLRDWLRGSDPVRKSQVAFKLNIKVTSSQFCAGKIVLDLPGMSSPIEPQSCALVAAKDDTYTAVPIGDDVNTAQPFEDNDYMLATTGEEAAPKKKDKKKNKKKKAVEEDEPKEKGEERCAFLTSWLNTIFPPVAEPAEAEA